MTLLPIHFFRREYGRLVAVLSRRVGVQQLDLVEDAVQTALLRAVEVWPRTVVPDNPGAWLYQVAYHELVNVFEAQRRHGVLERQWASPIEGEGETPDIVFDGEISDDVLRLLFRCCDEVLPIEVQLVLALKLLCGFDVREIAHRLLVTEASVYKRLSRGRARLVDGETALSEPEPSTYAARLPVVHGVLYLLFTEGYLAAGEDYVIRRELCDEALRLCEHLLNDGVGRTPETYALYALFCLHAARLSSRQNDAGSLLLLAEQDRGKWDQAMMARGLQALATSASGDVLSRYHLEAAIAAEHGLAPSFATTRWQSIAETYELLERLHPSPMHRLNRALAVAEYRGPEAALELLAEGVFPPWLVNTVWWCATLADLHWRAGNEVSARRYQAEAFAHAPNPAIALALQRRLGGYGAGGSVVAD